MSDIVVRGARVHNLKSIDVTIPRAKLTVVTGPSGSGKSSLAFDTIYAESQRRFVESLSVYARQFLDRLPRPDVDFIDGLSPAISIEQSAPSRNPRSTVGTVTEIYDHLRLLFARVGEPHCPNCGKPIRAHTIQEMVDRVLALPEGARFSVLSPTIRDRKGKLDKELAQLRKDGFVRARIDGAVRDLGDEIELDKKAAHTIEVYVDRLSVKSGVRNRLTESIELAAKLAGGLVRIVVEGQPDEMLFSERFACAECGIALPEITPRLFSFNSHEGACPTCGGLGERLTFEASLVVPDETLSIRDGAIAPWGKPGGAYHTHMLDALGKVEVDVDAAFESLPKKKRELVLQGSAAREAAPGKAAEWEGVLPGLNRRLREYEKRKREEGRDDRAVEYLEEELGQYASLEPCESCRGARLRPEALAVTIADKNIDAVCKMTIREAADFFAALPLAERQRAIADRVVREIDSRLGFLRHVGLDYLSLQRQAGTLSGGETERIRLATQIGAGLVGVLYVLDEPSVGLHPRDNARLVETLLALRDRGNTVIVVEHDEATIRAADYVVDMGPAAGANGGRVVAVGNPSQIEGNPESPTGAFLSGRERIEVPRRRRNVDGPKIAIKSARTHNLRGVDVDIPIGAFTCVTGVSGSGKSSLIVDTLVPAMRQLQGGARVAISAQFAGLNLLDKLIDVDQSPIGRTPRSSPASYTGLLASLRELYANLPEARARGYGPGRFSANVKGGRCEACQGDGLVKIEMHFLPDVYVVCDACGGSRFNRETLEVRYRGASIADALASSVDAALELFGAIPKLRERLEALRSVGLGYLALGQSATTLSGGEAQRVKLARELARRGTGRTLYVLDEPTTGLHLRDVAVLVDVLHALVDAGNTVVVIEHQMDLVKTADFIVDLGPDGGDGGGEVVAMGTPEQVAKVEASHTAKYLRPLL